MVAKRSRKRSSMESPATTASTATATSFELSERTRHNIKAQKHKSKHKPMTIVKRIARASSLSPSTVQAVGVLFVAILAGVIWNIWDGAHTWNRTHSQTDQRIKRFLMRVCQDNDVYCHPSLVPKRRTQVAIRDIPPGERILEVPRSMQIWDLDALRDPWIRQHLWGAKHGQTENALDSAAYLAAYLVLLAKEIVRPTFLDTVPNRPGNKTNSSRLLQYLKECMPSRDDLADFHPIVWDEKELISLVPPHSATFAVAKAYIDMVKSEYKAFAVVYKKATRGELQDTISEDEYRAFRILVLSRSFGTGLVPVQALESSDSSISHEELETYAQELGVDLSKGCYSMVPILDFYDHHARPNVQYAYSSAKDAFIIRATNSGIAAGYEVMDTYGKYTDVHLFAKFGFVNGDGSGYSQASLAVWHRLMDVDLKKQFSYLPMKGSQLTSPELQKVLDKQKEDVKRYINFDDGYETCILDNSRHPQEAYELKSLKMQHLSRIANHARRWNIVMLPRAPDSLPAKASNIPITMAAPKVARDTQLFHRKEHQLVSATCRLISLTHDDYSGKAIDILKENLNNNSFLLEPQLQDNASRDSLEAALEFRTHFCLARLANEALQRYGVTIADEEYKVSNYNRNAFQRKAWTAAHLRLSEMQTLEALRAASFSAARAYEGLRNKSPAFTIRDTPCSYQSRDD